MNASGFFLGSKYDTITLGSGAGDTVNLGAAFNNTITLGDGAGDKVYTFPTLDGLGSQSGTITLGNGVGDTLSLRGIRQQDQPR